MMHRRMQLLSSTLQPAMRLLPRTSSLSLSSGKYLLHGVSSRQFHVTASSAVASTITRCTASHVTRASSTLMRSTRCSRTASTFSSPAFFSPRRSFWGFSRDDAASRATHAKSQALEAHFVPFRLTLKQAQEIYLAWARGQYLAPESLKSLTAVKDVDQSYLPFFVFDAEVASRFGGQIGFRTTTLVWNAQTRSFSPRTTTQWRRVPLDTTATRWRYTSDETSMQIYSAFKYKWEPIQVVKNSPLGHLLRTPAQMSPSDFSGKEVDTVTMKIDTAQGRVLEHIRVREQDRGSSVLQAKYGGDEFITEAEVRVLNMTVRRVYQPAFVFHLEHLGQKFEVIVNGVTGAVRGQYIYSSAKAGLAFGLPASLAYAVAAVGFHAVPLSFTSYVGFVMLPSLVAAVIGHYWANFREYFREMRRDSEREADASMRAGSHGGQQWARQQREQTEGWEQEQRTEERYEQAYQRGREQASSGGRGGFGAARRSAPPAASYYDILGISRSASLDEIRTAFRAKSFQHHPDVNKGHEAEANKKFRMILEAYQTLRDPQKRAQYDRGL